MPYGNRQECRSAQSLSRHIHPPPLSILLNAPESFAGRKVGALVTDGVDRKILQGLRDALDKEGAMLTLVAPQAGGVEASDGTFLRPMKRSMADRRCCSTQWRSCRPPRERRSWR